LSSRSFLLFFLFFRRQLKSANGASVFSAQPWCQAARMEDMPARHEHAVRAQLDMLDTNSARGRLIVKITTVSAGPVGCLLFVVLLLVSKHLTDVACGDLCAFTVLLFYFDYS
jgi:hypothetical protein